MGSAVPFDSGGFPFLITAAHVCRDGRPLVAVGNHGPRVLRQQRLVWEYRRNETPDRDIALIALSDEDAADLSACYQFSTPATTASATPRIPGVHYLIAGYPAVRNRMKLRGDAPPGRATYLITGNIVPVSTLSVIDKSDASHFALSFHDAEIQGANGTLFRIPKPHGMSGGGVWRLDIDVGAGLATMPMLVGVGIEYLRHTETFVASRIQLAIPLSHDLQALTAGITPADVLPPENPKNK